MRSSDPAPRSAGLRRCLPAPALAQQAAPGQNITVTGVRIQDYRDRLAACLARNCPVNEDVDATLALAEALFLNGEYREARERRRASLGRNRDARPRSFPEPVSDLYRVDAPARPPYRPRPRGAELRTARS